MHVPEGILFVKEYSAKEHWYFATIGTIPYSDMLTI